IILPDGESYKNWDHLSTIFDRLLAERHGRDTTIIALGGGVIGDMTGFAAATYQRGVNFVQVPTTLLSQVDSSVGGKVAINHPLGKNMIGSFYQPQAVLIDPTHLLSLPARELAAGLAEVIKYGLVYDLMFFEWLEQNLNSIQCFDIKYLTDAIAQSCKIKAKIVTEDEKELGVRAILNFGHTFGHAIETHQGYGVWLHGEAVAVGSVMALELSYQQGFIAQEDRDRVISLFLRANLPVIPPENMKPEDFMRHMSIDKKIVDGQLHFILLEKLGKAIVTKDFCSKALDATLNMNYATLVNNIVKNK
ncbi:UNVERIFIED_CONTAM: hypothetical protein GTU68_056974, partial [Idotea baltica]|nr:hypothetical protein [Idotea baltica]